MKRKISVLFAFLLIVNYSCKEKIDFEKEKTAIMAVIEEETASYYASDFERWSATYLQDSTTVSMNSSKSDFSFNSGWTSISDEAKPYIVGEKEIMKEVKTPLSIKVYEESAWAIVENEDLNDKNESQGKAIATNFLEKHDGKWKIVYRNVLWSDSYTQADIFLVMSISYAKSLGKDVEDLASFAGDNVKTTWNQANGFNGLVNGILYYWRIFVPIGELKVLEQDENHIIFNANKMLTGLKRRGTQFNVSYEDYLEFYRIVFEKIADYMGGTYNQETTPDGVLVTITKKKIL